MANYSQNDKWDKLPFFINQGTVPAGDVPNQREMVQESTTDTSPTLPVASAPNPALRTPTFVLPTDVNDRHGELMMWQYLNDAGLSVKDDRTVNKKIIENGIDLRYQIGKNDEEYFHHGRMLALDMMYSGMKSGDYVQGPNGGFIPAPKPQHIDLRKLENEFQKKFILVKIRSRTQTEPTFFWLCEEANRHVPATFDEIKQEYLDFLEARLPDDTAISGQERDRSLHRLKHAIPLLKNSGLQIVENTKILFNDGILDVKTTAFTKLDRNERHKYFTLFSINIDFEEKTQEPTAFDAMLGDMFGFDSKKKQLAYQMIGAFLTPVPISKKLYLFQGMSNAGKTRLSRIIERLMEEDDTHPLPSLSGITSESLVNLGHPIRLVIIQEMGRNKIPSKQLAMLKGFADGNDIPGAATFKILMNTNYPIATGDNGFIEPAMLNRLEVLPFAKAMDNNDPRVAAFEDCHFAREKAGIIHKALLAFSEVINNGGKFCASFAPNECVQVAELPGQLSAEEREQMNAAAAKRSAAAPEDEETKLQQALKATFVLQDNPNPLITPEVIMDTINEGLPGIVKDTASLGKVLKATFGESLINSRLKGRTCYNLAWKDPEEENAYGTRAGNGD